MPVVITGRNSLGYRQVGIHAEGTLTKFPATSPATLSVVGAGVVNSTQAKFGTDSFCNPGTDVGGTNYGRLIDTTGSGLFIIPASTEFTCEFFVYFDSFNTDNFVIMVQSPGTFITTNQFFIQLVRSTGTLVAVVQSTTIATSASGAILTGQWYHVAVTRDATNTCRLYVEGVNGPTNNVFAGQIGVDDGGGDSSMFWMGGPIAADNSDVDGYMEEFRWINGFAAYTGAGSFTPPTAPFTAVI